LTTIIIAALVPALATVPALARQRAAKNGTDDACRPAALREFCRVGCIDPPPAETHRVDPSLKDVRHPLPSGVAILELGVDLMGQPVSACILRSVRDDFDKAAQAAALQSRWKVPQLKGHERGFALTVTACTPDRSSDCPRHDSK
jgi:hypothetical protein